MTEGQPASLRQRPDEGAVYRAAFESARDAVVLVDGDGRVLAWNPAAERLFGRDAATAIGADIELVLPAGSHALGGPALATADGRRVEFTALGADGTTFAAEATISNGPDPASRLLQIRDVSERTRIAEALRFRETLLALQSEAALDGILVIDAGWRPRWWNRRLCELFGVTDAELEAADDTLVRKVLGELAEPGRLLDELRTLAEDPDASIRNEITLRDGTVFDRWTAPLVSKDGERYGWVWSLRDITDRKLIERRLREDEEQADFLADASDVLVSSVDSAVVLERLTTLVTDRLAAACAVHRVVGGDVARVALSFDDIRLRTRFDELSDVYQRDPLEAVPAADAVATGEPIRLDLLPGTTDDATDARSLLARLGLATVVSIPLVAGDRVLGAISLGATSPAPRDRHLAVGTALAARVSVALENLALYEERDRIARTLQEALRPAELPVVPGLEVVARYLPAGEGSQVGGDFFDLFSTGRRTWAAVLGDVSGKGVEAARLTALTRYALRAAGLNNREPTKLLSVLNATLHRDAGTDRFCTAICARITRGLGGIEVRLSSAGHPLPYLVTPSGVRTLGRTGTLLGVVRDPDLATDRVRLRAGQAIVLYTDGITEARRDGEQFGEGRFEALLDEHRDSSADEIADAITSAALAFQGGVAADDMALLVLRRPRPERRRRRRGRSGLG